MLAIQYDHLSIFYIIWVPNIVWPHSETQMKYDKHIDAFNAN